MYRVTTPTHTFTLPIETSLCSVIQVAYKQGSTALKKQYEDGILPEGMSLNGNDVVVALSQEETKSFNYGTLDVQVRVLTTGGQAYASQHFSVDVGAVNNDEVLR